MDLETGGREYTFQMKGIALKLLCRNAFRK